MFPQASIDQPLHFRLRRREDESGRALGAEADQQDGGRKWAQPLSSYLLSNRAVDAEDPRGNLRKPTHQPPTWSACQSLACVRVFRCAAAGGQSQVGGHVGHLRGVHCVRGSLRLA